LSTEGVSTRRMTVAQAVVEFLTRQFSERDGARRRLIPGCFGIFGHGNVAGIGEALQEAGDGLRYYQARNEQAMVHAASAYAKMTNRLATFACTTSVGPGATNMVTAAAGATINHVPVLLLPGDVFASRGPAPVLQQLEHSLSPSVSVNDCLRPVARYWDRITRPEQLVASLPAAMRVLTDPAETGAVVLALPEDVQVEAWEFPVELFSERVWHVRRQPAPADAVAEAARLVRSARRPLIIAGGGVIYSEATGELRSLVEATGIPVGETQAGKGSLAYDHRSCLGGVGVTGTPAANEIARTADVVIGIGTRWTDFTTASHTIFSAPGVRFVNINVAGFDAAKHAGIAMVADARAGLAQLAEALRDYRVSDDYREEAASRSRAWDEEVSRIYEPGLAVAPDSSVTPSAGGLLDEETASGARSAPPRHLLSQGEVIGAVNHVAEPGDVVVCAAGSMPGDLHKLWRTRDPKGYHVEYGYSCMGYEIAGGLGVKLAAPEREVFVLVGDGSYLMMSSEIVTSIQEGAKLVIVIVQNHGYASIGSLSVSIGSGGFGTSYRYRSPSGSLDGDKLPVDLAANAASLGAEVFRARSASELGAALKDARAAQRTAAVYVETDPTRSVPGFAWWEVPVAEVSTRDSVRAARATYEKDRMATRPYL